MTTATLSRHIGAMVKEISKKRWMEGRWYTPHMAAASRAIAERIPLVDIVVEVRDARVLCLFLLFFFGGGERAGKSKREGDD